MNATLKTFDLWYMVDYKQLNYRSLTRSTYRYPSAQIRRWSKENTILVSFYIKFSKQEPETALGWRGSPSQSGVLKVEVDKLYIKDTYIVFYVSGIIKDFKALRDSNKWKNKPALFNIAEAANALWRMSVASFNQSNVVNVNMQPIVFRDRI